MTTPNNYPSNPDAQLLALIDQHVFSTPPTHSSQTVERPAQPRYTPPEQPPRQSENGPEVNDFDDFYDDRTTRGIPEHKSHTGRVIAGVVGFCVLVGGGSVYELAHNHTMKGKKAAMTAPLGTPSHISAPSSPATSPTDLPTTNPSVSPSETTLPSDSPSASASTSPSTSPTAIPKFSLAGAKLDCAPVANISVSESIPVAISRKFDGTFLAPDGKSTVPDPNTYTFQAGAGADIHVAMSGTVPLDVCVPDASKLFTADPAAAEGTNAYTIDLSEVPLQFNASTLAPSVVPAATKAETEVYGSQNGKRMVYKIGKGAPQFLADLCIMKATAENAKKPTTPAEAQACSDVDPQNNDWTNLAHPPVSALYNQIKNQVSAEANDIAVAATTILYGQLDTQQMQAMEAPVKTYLSAGLRSLAQQQGVPTQNVIIDQFSKDLASQQAAYLAKHPAAKTQIASMLKTYVLSDKNVKTYLAKYPSTSTDLSNLLAVYQKQNPTAKPFPFYTDDAPNTSASITVTPVEQD